MGTIEGRRDRAHPHGIACGVLLQEVARRGRTTEGAPVSARLKRPDAVPLPSAQDGTFEAPGVLRPRQLSDIVHDDAVTYVKNGVAIIQMRYSLVGGKGLTRCASVGGGGAAMPSGAYIQRMAPGVVGVKSDAVAGLLAQRHLHRVVVGIHIVLPVANPEIVGIQDARRVGVGQGTS